MQKGSREAGSPYHPEVMRACVTRYQLRALQEITDLLQGPTQLSTHSGSWQSTSRQGREEGTGQQTPLEDHSRDGTLFGTRSE